MFTSTDCKATRATRLFGMPAHRSMSPSFEGRLLNLGQASLTQLPVQNGTAPLP